MSILWCGGEDVDFPNGGFTITVGTSTSNYRTGYARCTVLCNTAVARSNNFPGGAVTSCWFSCRMVSTSNTSQINCGLTKDSSSQSGLYVGTGSVGGKLVLYKYDGTTKTALATDSGTSIVSGGGIYRIDMQVINYGVSATVNVYVNFILILTFTGDVTVTGVTSLSAAGIWGPSVGMSEFIVSDLDTRSLQGLVTLALTGAGTVNAWTNPTFSNINGTTLSDASPTNSNTNGQDNQYNVTDLPAGAYDVKAVKTAIRAAVSSTPAVTKIKMGYDSGGTIGFGTGASKTPATAYGTFEQLDAINPVTSSQWLQSQMNALQLTFRSET